MGETTGTFLSPISDVVNKGTNGWKQRQGGLLHLFESSLMMFRRTFVFEEGRIEIE